MQYTPPPITPIAFGEKLKRFRADCYAAERDPDYQTVQNVVSSYVDLYETAERLIRRLNELRAIYDEAAAALDLPLNDLHPEPLAPFIEDLIDSNAR